jgi:hypothetical protein
MAEGRAAFVEGLSQETCAVLDGLITLKVDLKKKSWPPLIMNSLSF